MVGYPNYPRVVLSTGNLPKSKRLKIGRKYITLTQPNVKFPLRIDPTEYLDFVRFLGYWTGSGYYEKYGVVVCCKKRIRDLIPIFDSVATLFQCKYRVSSNGLIKFDSSLLKYVMLGLGFINDKMTTKSMPGWIQVMPIEVGIAFVQGLFTAKAKVIREIISCRWFNKNLQFDVAAILDSIGIHLVPWLDTNLSHIDTRQLGIFYNKVAFLDLDKNTKLQKIIDEKQMLLEY